MDKLLDIALMLQLGLNTIEKSYKTIEKSLVLIYNITADNTPTVTPTLSNWRLCLMMTDVQYLSRANTKTPPQH